MEIRILRREEIKNASGLCRYVFDVCLRNRMDYPQTIAFVEEYLVEENLENLINERKLIIWGAFEEEQMIGVSGMQSDGMITLLYVLPQCQNRGCGSRMLKVMLAYAKDICDFKRVTLNANPAWTSFFFGKRGFFYSNKNQDFKAPFVPMYLFLDGVGSYKKRKVSKKWIALAITGCIVFTTIVGSLFMVWYLF